MCKEQNREEEWKARFLAGWALFEDYHLRQYRKRRKDEKFCYETPDRLRRYLQQGPCRGCPAEDGCDRPCGAYFSWWDAKMAVLKHRWGLDV